MAVVKPTDTLELSFQTASLHELLEMRHIAAQHSPGTLTLRISIGSFTKNRSWIEVSAGLQYVDYRPIDWAAPLALLPKLRRLDLSEIPLTSLHVRKIVEAADERCAELEALVLPTRVTQRGLLDEVEPLLCALSEAVKQWGSREESPGLEELTLPCYVKSSRGFSSAELIQLVLVRCPSLTALDVALCVMEDGSDAIHDCFCESLVTNCPLLSRFIVCGVFFGRPANVAEMILTLTDRGLVALAELASLSDLQLQAANITGDRLFEFLSALSTEPCGSRLLQISIGGLESTLRLLEAFRTLMERLEATSPDKLRFATSDFLLRVNNANTPDKQRLVLPLGRATG